MKRIHHPYTAWEEFHAGMWDDVTSKEREELLAKAIGFTGNAELYGSFMFRVIVEWPISCEHNLTDVGQNRKAWLGHAACCLAIQCPEHVTRNAWGYLTQKQQDDANAQAGAGIKSWETSHEKKNQEVRSKLALERLSRWDTGRSSATTGAGMQSAVLPGDMSGHHEERYCLDDPRLFQASLPLVYGTETHRD